MSGPEIRFTQIYFSLAFVKVNIEIQVGTEEKQKTKHHKN